VNITAVSVNCRFVAKSLLLKGIGQQDNQYILDLIFPYKQKSMWPLHPLYWPYLYNDDN